MALDLFRLYTGLDVSNEDLTSNAYILQGAGTPAGAEADAAPVGSTWMDTTPETDKLQFWWKHTSGTGLDKWTRAANTSYVDAAVQGISWREPVVVQDTTLYANAAAFDVTGTINGHVLANGDRVLFSNVTAAGDRNVFIWNASTSSWTEDTNAETDGDAVFVQMGTNAEQQWMFDGTNWFQFGGSSNTEILNIRNFVGKDTAGANFPNYVSNDVVTDGLDLRLATSQLDDAIGLLQFTTNNVIADFVPGTIQDPDNGVSTSSTTDITSALNAIDATYGSGVITNTAANYPLTANMIWNGGTLTLTSALNELNNATGSRNYTSSFIVTSGQTVTASIDAIDLILGDINNSSVYSAGGFLSTAAIAGNSVQQTFDSFNVELGTLAAQTYINTGSATVSTTTPLEPVGAQLATSTATEIEWLVQVKDSAGKRQAFKVHAITNGTTVDWTQFAVIKTGGNIGGSVGFSVAISGGNIVPSLTPQAGAGNLTFTIKRLGYSYLA
jgi:hypothetical protein